MCFLQYIVHCSYSTGLYKIYICLLFCFWFTQIPLANNLMDLSGSVYLYCGLSFLLRIGCCMDAGLEALLRFLWFSRITMEFRHSLSCCTYNELARALEFRWFVSISICELLVDAGRVAWQLFSEWAQCGSDAYRSKRTYPILYDSTSGSILRFCATHEYVSNHYRGGQWIWRWGTQTALALVE